MLMPSIKEGLGVKPKNTGPPPPPPPFDVNSANNIIDGLIAKNGIRF